MDKPLGEIELSEALGQILQISARFDICVQPQFNLLQKTMVMAEGVARSLNPKANMWHLAKPLASEWIQSQTGFSLKLQEFFSDIERIVRTLPKIIDKYEKSVIEQNTERNENKKSFFMSNLGWFFGGISISVAFFLFYS